MTTSAAVRGGRCHHGSERTQLQREALSPWMTESPPHSNRDSKPDVLYLYEENWCAKPGKLFEGVFTSWHVPQPCTLLLSILLVPDSLWAITGCITDKKITSMTLSHLGRLSGFILTR